MAVALYDIYISLLVLLSLLVAYRFKQLDNATRMIALLVFLSLVTEIAGRYFASKGSNHPIYNISCFIEWGLLCLYFNYSVGDFEKKHFGWYLAIGGILFGVINLKFQPIEKLSSNFMFLECMGICCLSAYSVYKFVVLDDDSIKLQKIVHFWIPFILVLYQCGALWSWIAYDYYVEVDKKVTGLLHILLITNSIIIYSGLATVFFLYPKMRKTHV